MKTQIRQEQSDLIWVYSVCRSVRIVWMHFCVVKSHCRVVLLVKHNTLIWAATWQNQQSHCAPSEDSDQTEHLLSLIRVFAERYPAKEPSFLHADSEDSDQTRWTPRHFVDFVMSRLISHSHSYPTFVFLLLVSVTRSANYQNLKSQILDKLQG